MRAPAIVMPLPRRVDGASLFGKTLETVLAERPCRVIIESDARRGRRARRDAAPRRARAEASRAAPMPGAARRSDRDARTRLAVGDHGRCSASP